MATPTPLSIAWLKRSAGQQSLHSRLGRMQLMVSRENNILTLHAYSQLCAAGGEVAFRSPRGQWLQRLARHRDHTYGGIARLRGLLRAAEGEIQQSSPEGQWDSKVSFYDNV